MSKILLYGLGLKCLWVILTYYVIPSLSSLSIGLCGMFQNPYNLWMEEQTDHPITGEGNSRPL